MTSRAAAVWRFLFLSCRRGRSTNLPLAPGPRPCTFIHTHTRPRGVPAVTVVTVPLRPVGHDPVEQCFSATFRLSTPRQRGVGKTRGIPCVFPLTNILFYYFVLVWLYVNCRRGPHAVNVRCNTCIRFYSIFFFLSKISNFKIIFYLMTHHSRVSIIILC